MAVSRTPWTMSRPKDAERHEIRLHSLVELPSRARLFVVHHLWWKKTGKPFYTLAFNTTGPWMGSTIQHEAEGLTVVSPP